MEGWLRNSQRRDVRYRLEFDLTTDNRQRLFIENIKDKDALYCLLTDKIDSEVIDAAVNLRVVATMSVGFDHLGY